MKIIDKARSVPLQVKASSAYMICSILQRSLSFITLPIFARLLTTEEYGLSVVYNSTMCFLIIFTTLQLPYGTFDKAMIKFESDRLGYVSSVNGLCTLLTVIYLIAYFCYCNFFDELSALPHLLLALMGIEMLMSTSINFWMGYKRFEYKYKQVVFVTLLMSIMTVVVSVSAVLSCNAQTDKGIVRLLSSSFVVITIGFVIYCRSLYLGKKFFNRTYWHYALSFNIPLIPYYLSQMIFNQSDRLMIDSMCGRGDAAKYGVAFNLGILLHFVLAAINSSYTPWLYNKIKNKDFEENKVVSVAIAILMSTLLLGVISFAPEIIYILAGPKYLDAVWVVPPISMGLLFLFYTQLFGSVEFYYEKKYYLVAGSIISAVLNVLLNWIFIDLYGYIAAAYTSLLCFIVFALCNYVCMKCICKQNQITAQMFDLRKLIVICFVFVILSFSMMLLYDWLIVRLVVIALFLLLIVYKRDYILNKGKFTLLYHLKVCKNH